MHNYGDLHAVHRLVEHTHVIHIFLKTVCDQFRTPVVVLHGFHTTIQGSVELHNTHAVGADKRPV